MKSMKIITSPGDTQRLSNGLPIPGIGYGTYLAPDDTSGTRSILDALEAGYRLIDTASVYGNEKTVGAPSGTAPFRGRKSSSPAKSGTRTRVMKAP